MRLFVTEMNVRSTLVNVKDVALCLNDVTGELSDHVHWVRPPCQSAAEENPSHLEVSVVLHVLWPAHGWGSCPLQLLDPLADLVVQLLHLPQENPKRQPSAGVEKTAKPSMVPLCVIGSTGAITIEVVPVAAWSLLGSH